MRQAATAQKPVERVCWKEEATGRWGSGEDVYTFEGHFKSQRKIKLDKQVMRDGGCLMLGPGLSWVWSPHS